MNGTKEFSIGMLLGSILAAASFFCFALPTVGDQSPATNPASIGAASRPASRNAIFARSNIAAWCIVPYDGRHRGPAERAEMLDRIGLHHFVYDWRAAHLPGFPQELDELAKHHIMLDGVWFPDALNADARFILDNLAKHHVKTQLWIMSGGYNQPTQEARVAAAVERMRVIAVEAGKIGCTVCVYNHGGWFGEGENQIAIIKGLKADGIENVGIVYNLHHAFGEIDKFDDLLPKLLPHLLAVNLNGMSRIPASAGEPVVPVGQGELDVHLLKTIRDSGFSGPIGIINESDRDAEGRLLDNLDGIRWILPQLDGEPAGDRPEPRTWTAPAKSKGAATAPSASVSGAVDHWSVENPKLRELLAKYKTIPASMPEELTPANGWPDQSEYADWFRSHGNDGSTRFSQLAQINRGNVKSLKVAWTYHSGDGRGNIECNPINVEGTIYAPTVGDCVVAINGETGAEIWRFKPQGKPAFRGLTYYKGDGKTDPRLLFVAGNDLWSLNPKDGKPVESFGQGGKEVSGQCVVAPAVYQNIIVLAGWYGDLFGFDLLSGKPLWTFHTIPHPGEPYYDTWDKPAEGANAWGGMSLDESRGIAYVQTGSPKPNFVGVGHLGDNLFGNCVLAIDVTNGMRMWHFQEIRHDIWDLDGSAPPALVTIDHDGRKVDAVAAVTKIGNTLLLDRVTGVPLFPFRLRRAPASKLPGERTAFYQPDVELPQPFSRQVFAKDDVTDISPASRNFILDKISKSQMGWFQPFDEGSTTAYFGIHGGAEWTGAAFDPESGLLYVSSNELPWLPGVFRSEHPAVDETKLPPTPGRSVYMTNCMPCHGPSREGKGMFPSLLGLSHRLNDEQVLALLKTGRGAMPAAAQVGDAQKKVLLDYIFDRDRPDAEPTERPERPGYADLAYPKLLDADGYPGCKPPWGLLNAIDLNTGKIAWRVPLGEYPELTARGIPKTGTENFGGAIVTAGGLVFCGGTRDIKIRAFDKSTGEELWSSPLPFGGFAPPATYQVNGKQYVIISATGGGKLNTPTGDAYVAFGLP
jgi:quinoprotein glucose dehydrogenase